MARIEQGVKLSEIQQKLWDALEDGEPHTFKSLCLLIDEQYDLACLRMQMCHLRTKLRQSDCNETVIFEQGNYRRVRYINAITSMGNPINQVPAGIESKS